jgi:hypothetical protein
LLNCGANLEKDFYMGKCFYKKLEKTKEIIELLLSVLYMFIC